MMPERMSKAIIAGPKTVMQSVINELHSIKAIHISEQKPQDMQIGEPLKEAEKLSETLVTIRSIISHLGINSGYAKTKKPYRVSSKDAQNIKALQKEVNEKLEKLKSLDEKLRALEQVESELAMLSQVKLPLEAYTSYKTLTYFAGKAKNAEEIRKAIGKVTDKFELYSSEDKKFAVIFAEAEKRQAIQDALGSQGFSDMNMASAAGMKGSPEENMKRAAQEKSRAEGQKSAVSAELKKLKGKWQETLISAESAIAEQLEKAEAPLRFGATKNTFLITGWVPSESMERLKQRLEIVSSGKIYLKELEIEEGDKVPVKLKNAKYAKPFEFFIRLRGLPMYNEIDPTPIVFISFPLFFGFMLGDIGYGIVTLLLAISLKKFLAKGKDLLNSIALAATVSIFFGLVFGEFFGEEALMGYELPHLISRAHQINELLAASIIFGILHINLGLALGFYNELKNHGLKKAVLEKASWLLIELGSGFALQLLGIIALPQPLFYASGASLLSGVAMLAAAELKDGIMGAVKAPIESITIFSNILSYARLMAVGLASVQLAIIVNEFAKEFFSKGGFMIIAGIAILLVGHTINIVLGILGAFLHSLRLQYVEFFTKFFKGGSEPYKPFGEKT
ncbi:V-type ATP synthase subunit I [Candidatus Woesearchaeota archaeon]|nr:V-type ATP synthase subunit I [Candidatus Woesearchaeota archaeon]